MLIIHKDVIKLKKGILTCVCICMLLTACGEKVDNISEVSEAIEKSVITNTETEDTSNKSSSTVLEVAASADDEDEDSVETSVTLADVVEDEDNVETSVTLADVVEPETETVTVEEISETVGFTEYDDSYRHEDVDSVEEDSFVYRAAHKIQADLFWFEGSKNRVSFLDMDNDGIPELSVTNFDKPLEDEDVQLSVYETKVYRLKDMSLYCTYFDSDWSLLNFYMEPTPHWGIVVGDDYYSFDEEGMHCDLWVDYAQSPVKFYYKGDEISNQEYINKITELFNGDNTDNSYIISNCESYITNDNIDYAYMYIEKALLNYGLDEMSLSADYFDENL